MNNIKNYLFKKLKNIFTKSVFSSEFSKIVFASVVINLGVLLIIFSVIYNYRDFIFQSFYKGDTTLVYNKTTEFVNTSLPIVETPPSVSDIVKKVSPSVVAITLYQDVPVYETYYEQQEAFGFPGFYINIPKQRQIGTKKQEVGGGSGFFITNDGLIVTNRHVAISDSVTYTVTTQNGKKYDAVVVGRDTQTDIALIKIKGSGFKKITFADHNSVVVGQSVIAIGNALAQFQNTVSVGIISGLGRTITASDGKGNIEKLDKVIQTDAAINPGNSGGPLINLEGNVVGVNVAVVQGGQSIGFSLPVDIVQAAIKRLNNRN
jgi:serine protease Do